MIINIKIKLLQFTLWQKKQCVNLSSQKYRKNRNSIINLKALQSEKNVQVLVKRVEVPLFKSKFFITSSLSFNKCWN